MILRQYQPALGRPPALGKPPVLGKPIVALLTVTLLALSGCSDEPQDTSRVESTQSNTAAAPTQAASEPVSNSASDSATVETTTASAADTDSGRAGAGASGENASGENASTENTDTANTAGDAATPEQPEAALSAEAGKELYEKQCKICHESGLLNAPKYGDKAAWQPHISKGMPILYEHSANGFNKMPPQAVNGVTDAQVHAAVDYMVAGSS